MLQQGTLFCFSLVKTFQFTWIVHKNVEDLMSLNNLAIKLMSQVLFTFQFCSSAVCYFTHILQYSYDCFFLCRTYEIHS